MSQPKKFGVWMDSVHATIVENKSDDTIPGLRVVAHVEGEKATMNSSEKNQHADERALLGKYFKEITKHMQNATHLHATGTGQVQEQFIHYLADTAQFKNVKSEHTTANKMSDERLLEFFADKIG